MLISKKHLALLSVIDKENFSGYDLHKMKICQNGEIIASDGHCVYIMQCQPLFNDNIPECFDNELLTDDVFIEADVLRQAEKNLPANNVVKNNQILNNISITDNGKEITLTTTNNKIVNKIEIKNEKGCYPDNDAIQRMFSPFSETDTKHFNMSVKNLQKLLDVAKKSDDDNIKFTVINENMQVKVETESFKGLLMPLGE